MKITDLSKGEILLRLEEFAKKLNQTASQVVIQDPQIFAEQLCQKGTELFAILKANLFRARARSATPEFWRSRIRKRVVANLEEEFQYPEVVEAVTDSLILAAKEDVRYQKLLGLEEDFS